MAGVAKSSSSAGSFARIEVRAPDRELAERLAADAFDAGATGLEERDGEGRDIALSIYAPAAAAPAVAAALRALAAPGARVDDPAPVVAQDWAESWKSGLRAVRVSERLLVRPSFAPPSAVAGQAELVIDPGQAFGTGSHASTLLALEWVDRLAPGLPAAAQILDVGCGTGVLALAALRLSRGTRALALDLDPEATRAARANARRNALEARLDVLQGPLAALRDGGFALVLANLLRSELVPLLPEIARHCAPRGAAVLSGLLDSDREETVAALARSGFALHGERASGSSGDERWIALLTRR